MQHHQWMLSIRTCFQFGGLCFSSLTHVRIATEHYVIQQDLYLALWHFRDALILYKRWCFGRTSQGFVFHPPLKYFTKPLASVHPLPQATGGHRGWAQWHTVRVGAFRGAWLAGLHLYQTDGPDAATKWRKASLP